MPVWLSQADYARHRKCSRAAVNKAIKTGRIKDAVQKDGRLDRDLADAMWAGNSVALAHTPAAAGPATAPAPVAATSGPGPPASPEQSLNASGTYAQARGVREAYQARIARLDYEERLGLLVKLADVRITVFAQHRRVRDLLATLPDRLIPLMPVEGEERTKLHRAVAHEVHRALAELRDEFAERTEGAGSEPS